jgi:DNA polymerase I-like protein with 3'-5' exonuclease and polymerase domains
LEVEEKRANEISLQIVGIMENIFQLSIPLKAKLNISKNWGNLK